MKGKCVVQQWGKTCQIQPRSPFSTEISTHIIKQPPNKSEKRKKKVSTFSAFGDDAEVHETQGMTAPVPLHSLPASIPFQLTGTPVEDFLSGMGDEWFNSWTRDQPDQVNRYLVRSSVFIVSNPAQSDSIAVKTEIGLIPKPGTGSWRGSVHRVESGERTLFPNQEQQLLWN